MIHAEKQLIKKYRNPWSPILIQARQKLIYWKMWWSEIKNKIDLSQSRQDIATRIKWTDIPVITTPVLKSEIKQQLKSAHAYIKECEKNAAAIRDQHLEDRAYFWAQADERGPLTILESMRASETAQRMFANFRHMEGKSKSGSLTTLKIPDPNYKASEPPNTDPNEPAKWKTIFDAKRITELLIARNKKHFSQATGTPFASTPLLEIVGQNAEHGLECIQEALDQPENSAATNAILNNLNSYKLPNITTDFEKEEIRSGYKAWRETTSTSPNKNHLGHPHAILAPDESEEDYELRIAAIKMKKATKKRQTHRK